MEIIAKTDDGCLIMASDREVKEILRSVSGKVPDELSIGQKIPAIDYASTITQVKALGDDYDYRQLLQKVEVFNRAIDSLKESIQNASLIEV